MFETQPRIPTHLWVEAKVRELNAQNIPTFVLHRGEKMDGVILLKISNCHGNCILKTRQRNLDGILQWIDVFAEEIIDESKADDYINRSKERDPDLWAIEIEHPEMDINLI